MSPRIRRQEIRKAAGHSYKPYDSDDKPAPIHKSKKSVSETATADNGKGRLRTKTDTARSLGMPTREQYQLIEEEYIRCLHARKQEKALLTQEMFDNIWDVLHDPAASRIGSPQFRWWVRKMFVLSNTRSNLSPAEAESLETLGVDSMPVVLHENRPVALKDQIYDVLCYCHDLAKHGGRDKTTAVVREHYSWIPKELIAQFVKSCPTCIYKKTGSIDLALSANGRERSTAPQADENEFDDHAQQASLSPANESLKPEVMHCIPPHIAAEIPRDSLPPDGMRSWHTVSEPIHSPTPVHPPLMTRAWTDSTAYNSQESCWPPSHLEERPGIPVACIQPHDGLSREFYKLPPIRRIASADDAGAGGARQVTLPPLMKVLSEGPWATHTALSSDVMARHGYPPSLAADSRLSCSNEQAYVDPEEQEAAVSPDQYVPNIDPALLEEDDVARSSYIHSPYPQGQSLGSHDGLQTNPYHAALEPMSSPPRLSRATSVLHVSNSMALLSLGSRPLTDGLSGAFGVGGLDDMGGEDMAFSNSASRFVFPTSLSRLDDDEDGAAAGHSFVSVSG